MLNGFTFKVLSALESYNYKDAKNEAHLIIDGWDDWFEYSTLFILKVFDANGEKHSIGPVKIAEFGIKKGDYYKASDSLPREFSTLPYKFFSLGQDDSYFESLNDLGDNYRDHIFACLHEISVDDDLYARAIEEPVTKVSLLRSVSVLNVKDQYQRLASGGARLTEYDFSYRMPRFRGSELESPTLTFSVRPNSSPPTNMHVVIGRNGVGKTNLLRSMIRSLLDKPSAQNGMFFDEYDMAVQPTEIFSNLVSVTFSAFDPFENSRETKDTTKRIKYSYIGLQRPQTNDGKQQLPKSREMLANEFVKSAQFCISSGRKARWADAVSFLEYDQLIADSGIKDEVCGFPLAEQEQEDWVKRVRKIFGKFSSGHAIVLLTITKLVETVDEKTLVLMDEPEAYLHPPLQSAFIRSISNLLVHRNGVGILATHSPVILQEVPSSCVWKTHRFGQVIKADKPQIKTFGESVGVLTSEVFGLELTHTGFHKMIAEVVEQGLTFEQIVENFEGQMGKEAQAISLALTATRDVGEDSFEEN
ncbi:MAG: AAA family ATPase [Alphaproteobacteria bacterium]|nr:AAA family ATPase [Alphaproteobacteria bacterium]